MDWIVTIPQGVSWDEYQKELDAVADGGSILNYRVRYAPKGMAAGDRLFVTWRGQVRGWMAVSDIVHRPGFTCSTNGVEWPDGWYVQRTGLFHHVVPSAYPGFRGIRRYEQ